jgi:transcriptional regulator with XRE-family HTH domain
MNEIGVRLKEYFKEKGISQVEIAEKLGIAPSYITKIFKGERGFKKDSAKKWSELFGISEVFLLTGEGPVEMFVNQYNPLGLSEEKLMQLPKETLVGLLNKVITYHYNVCEQITKQNSDIIKGSKELSLEVINLCKISKI